MGRLHGVIGEARNRGCKHLPTAAELATRVENWIVELRDDCAQLGVAESSHCWNLNLWDGDGPSLCVFEVFTTDTATVELSFFVIAREPRDVIAWCEGDAPDATEVELARDAIRTRWGEHYATVTMAFSELSLER